MIDIPLRCQCGTVRGNVRLKAASDGNHVTCYCTDCQAFARHLPSTDAILDEWGGTEIYQTAPWTIEIQAGREHLRCLRLKPKGLYRWYTDCCNTAVGNAVSVKLPFFGLIHSFIDNGESGTKLLGPMIGHYKLESATGDVPEPIRKLGMPTSATLKVFWRILKWKLMAGRKPNPFFDQEGKAISPPTVLKANRR